MDKGAIFERLLKKYETTLPSLPPGFMGTHFIKSDEKIDQLLHLEISWKGSYTNSITNSLGVIVNIMNRRLFIDNPVKCSELIPYSDELDKKSRIFQEAVWEIFSTERSYVLVLKLAVDVYIATLLDLQQNGFLNQVFVV